MAFQVLTRFAKTPVLLIRPETGSLPPDMRTIARFMSGKSGGRGEVITALCEGLTKRGIEFHLTAPNQEFRRTYQAFPDTATLDKRAISTEKQTIAKNLGDLK